MGILDQNFGTIDQAAWRRPNEGGGDFKDSVPDPDDYSACIVRVDDIGIQEGYMGALKDQVCITFELDQVDEDGKPYVVHLKATKSMYERAPLYRLVCAALPGASHHGLKLGEIIGKCVYITVKVSEGKNGKKYPKVDGETIKKLPRGMAPFEPIGDYREPDGLVKWMMKQAITEEVANSRTNADFHAPKPGADDIDPDDDVPF